MAATGLFTPDEVAAALRISRRTLRRNVAAGRLEPVRLSGRTVRFRPAPVLHLLNGDGPSVVFTPAVVEGVAAAAINDQEVQSQCSKSN